MNRRERIEYRDQCVRWSRRQPTHPLLGLLSRWRAGRMPGDERHRILAAAAGKVLSERGRRN